MKNIIIIILTALSIFTFVCYIADGIEHGYTEDFNQRLLNDTKLLAAVVNQNLSPEELTSQIKSLHPETSIELRENQKSLWSYGDSPTYKSRVKANGLTFFYDENEKLVLIEHWLENNSPLKISPNNRAIDAHD